jgi:hypothetical protein
LANSLLLRSGPVKQLEVRGAAALDSCFEVLKIFLIVLFGESLNSPGEADTKAA